MKMGSYVEDDECPVSVDLLQGSRICRFFIGAGVEREKRNRLSGAARKSFIYLSKQSVEKQPVAYERKKKYHGAANSHQLTEDQFHVETGSSRLQNDERRTPVNEVYRLEFSKGGPANTSEAPK